MLSALEKKWWRKENVHRNEVIQVLMPPLWKNVVKIHCLMHISTWHRTCSYETWQARDTVRTLKKSINSGKSSRICFAGSVLSCRPQTLYTECLSWKKPKLCIRKWTFLTLTWTTKKCLKELLIQRGRRNWIQCLFRETNGRVAYGQAYGPCVQFVHCFKDWHLRC